MRFILTLAVLALAGCTAPATSQPSTPTTEAAALAPEVFLLDGNSNITGPGGYELNGPHPFNGFHLRIPYEENATAILAELGWADPVYDLDLVVMVDGYPGCRTGNPPDPVNLGTCLADTATFEDGNDGYLWNLGGSIGFPDSPSTIQLGQDAMAANLAPCEKVDECAWQFGVRSKEGAVNVAWTMAVSVFHDGEVPEGYSALSS